MRWVDELPTVHGVIAIALIVGLAYGLAWLLRRFGSPWRPTGDTLALLLIAALAVAVCAAAAFAAPVPKAAIEIVDGDTIRIDGVVWRLMDYDAPESTLPKCLEEQSRGLDAARRLRALVDGARSIEIDAPRERLDRWGRHLGHLRIDGEDAGAILIREHLALPYNGRTRRPSWCPSSAAS